MMLQMQFHSCGLLLLQKLAQRLLLLGNQVVALLNLRCDRLRVDDVETRQRDEVRSGRVVEERCRGCTSKGSTNRSSSRAFQRIGPSSDRRRRGEEESSLVEKPLIVVLQDFCQSVLGDAFLQGDATLNPEVFELHFAHLLVDSTHFVIQEIRAC